MPRQDYAIHTVSGRARLPARPTEPYWRLISPGKHIGYWKGKVETWRARWRDPRSGEKHFKSLGSVAEIGYGTALKEAETWWTQCEGGVPKAGTVEAACKDYVENFCADKGERAAYHARKAFETTVYDTDFGRLPLDELHAADVDKWKKALVVPGVREKNSANRILRSFKAAMNHAYRRGMAPTDKPWKVVKRFPVKDQKRERVLTKGERKALISAAAPDVALFLQALYYTAARPQEMAAAKVNDLDLRSQTLRLVTRKGDGTERTRSFPLDANPHAFAFFKSLAKDKLPGAPLIAWEDGGHLRKQHWVRGVRAAQKEMRERMDEEAGKKEALADNIVAYTMRHTAISEWLSEGIDIGAVAKWAGTSVVMIDMYYHKYIPNSHAAKLAHLSAM